MVKSLSSALALLMLATPALSACRTHTFGSCPPDNIVHWYDPDTGEICDPLDCGGGRASPKTNLPGCAGYKGTLTLATAASYMPCFTSAAPPPSPTPETTTTTPPPPPPTSNDASPTSAAETVAASSSTTGAGSASSATTGLTTLTTAPPSSKPPTSASSSSSSSSSSTTVPPNAGSKVVGGSWIAVAAGVAFGALAVI